MPFCLLGIILCRPFIPPMRCESMKYRLIRLVVGVPIIFSLYFLCILSEGPEMREASWFSILRAIPEIPSFTPLILRAKRTGFSASRAQFRYYCRFISSISFVLARLSVSRFANYFATHRLISRLFNWRVVDRLGPSMRPVVALFVGGWVFCVAPHVFIRLKLFKAPKVLQTAQKAAQQTAQQLLSFEVKQE